MLTVKDDDDDDDVDEENKGLGNVKAKMDYTKTTIEPIARFFLLSCFITELSRQPPYYGVLVDLTRGFSIT